MNCLSLDGLHLYFGGVLVLGMAVQENGGTASVYFFKDSSEL